MVKSKAKPPRKSSAAVDYYLHALLELTDHGQPADTGDVAAKVGVSAAATSEMLKRLAAQDLVKLEPYPATSGSIPPGDYIVTLATRSVP